MKQGFTNSNYKILKKTKIYKFIIHSNIVMLFEMLASENTGNNKWIIKAGVALEKASLNLDARRDTCDLTHATGHLT